MPDNITNEKVDATTIKVTEEKAITNVTIITLDALKEQFARIQDQQDRDNAQREIEKADIQTKIDAAVGLGIKTQDQLIPPVISITSPAFDSKFSAGSTISITADATDDVSVTSVEFFKNGESLGITSKSPYKIDWVKAQTGDYKIYAIATDGDNLTTQSEVIIIHIS